MQKHKFKMAVLLSLGLGLYASPLAMAMPQNGVIAGGSGSISASGSVMNVTQQTQNMFINWDSFSVGKGEKVQFAGPQDFAVLNRVVGHDESKIYGEISANRGNVYLVNPNGILIGDGAVINTGSFIASTKDVTDVPSFINGGQVNYQGDAMGNIINLGSVTADHIEMHGDTISLKAGNLDTNFNSSDITIEANAVHAGFWENEDGRIDEDLVAEVNNKLNVKADEFILKNSMSKIREAVKANNRGQYMLSQDDLASESWTGRAPSLENGAAIDGLGYTVGNKTITKGSSGTGIFSYICDNVRVDNFTFDHITVTDSSDVGTLAGQLDGDGIRIANVTVSNGSVTGKNYVGGLIGYSMFDKGNTFLNVHNVNTSVTGLIEGQASGAYTGIGIGGIIGYENPSWDRTENTNIFRNVSNSGTITGRMYVGGLAGRLSTADMDQVRNTGRIEQKTIGVQTKGGVSYEDSYYIGGIAGAIGPRMDVAAHVRIRNAYNSGTIGVDTSTDDYYDDGEYIGGIVGMISGLDKNGKIYGATDTVIEYAHNTGTITTGYKSVGGIVGFATGRGEEFENNASDMIIRHSFNDGEIRAYYSGGLAGTFGGTIEQSYNNGALNAGKYSGGLVAETDYVLDNDTVIRDSYNTANGTAHTGGIIGIDYSEGTTTLERVWNEASIYTDNYHAGGIIGEADDCSSITMNQVYNFGMVQGEDSTGGIIGETNNCGSITMNQVYNFGKIQGMYSAAAGGLIGETYDCGSITMSQVYNFGMVQGGDYTGGLIGKNDVDTDGTITIRQSANYGRILSDDGEYIGGFIGYFSTDGDNTLSITDSTNFGNVSGAESVGGFIGHCGIDVDSTQLEITNSHNYGTVTARDEPATAGGIIAYIDWYDTNDTETLSRLADAVHIKDSGTVGDIAVGVVDYKKDGKWVEEHVGDFGAETQLPAVPATTIDPHSPFLTWKNTTTVDTEGKVGTETGSYPDGGYVWKMYETGKKDGDGHTLFYKPLLTAFQTKVVTQENSVEAGAGDVSGALYDVTMPDGQQITGVDWQRVLALQDQFTRVQYRGDGSQQAAYTASNGEAGGSVPGHLYGFYNASQQGLNIFTAPGTVKPEEPVTPDIPHREISRNDYLYSDEHDTGDGKLNWYMHMPPAIYIQDAGVHIGDN